MTQQNPVKPKGLCVNYLKLASLQSDIRGHGQFKES